MRFVEAAATDMPPAPEPPPKTPWSYGTGRFDPETRRIPVFTPLPRFTGTAWQGADTWPGGATGWAQLTATGGHPGNTAEQACIRRFTAPEDLVVRIGGNLRHDPEAGDGVRAFVIHGRRGLLRTATVHHAKTDLVIESVSLQAGDTPDFVVDIGGTPDSGHFPWAPTVGFAGSLWDARADFGGPRPEPVLLEPWAQYAQILLLSNEFAFLD